jgi:hypothetical protein
MYYYILSAYTAYKTIEKTIEIANNVIYIINIVRASQIARKYL